jgi:hypothetical protein
MDGDIFKTSTVLESALKITSETTFQIKITTLTTHKNPVNITQSIPI